ncbi:MAG TPA: hypothetical protein VLW83_01615, partial [Candidatus Acidoferrales bacterium]|nr:hypothetical protein [Candidatus Acidoferrales bacterium]
GVEASGGRTDGLVRGGRSKRRPYDRTIENKLLSLTDARLELRQVAYAPMDWSAAGAASGAPTQAESKSRSLTRTGGPG